MTLASAEADRPPVFFLLHLQAIIQLCMRAIFEESDENTQAYFQKRQSPLMHLFYFKIKTSSKVRFG